MKEIYNEDIHLSDIKNTFENDHNNFKQSMHIKEG